MINNFMREAIELSLSNIKKGTGGPFAAVVVKDGAIVARGTNRVTTTNDPTAHAEIIAIRDACRTLKTFQLTGCDLYTSCEPCPMCLGAIYWARPDRVFFANTRDDAARIGFDDLFIYDEIQKPLSGRKIPMIKMEDPEAIAAFVEWTLAVNKTEY
jgi:tRNA(Arg) A34 adenosine deaminase TadA